MTQSALLQLSSPPADPASLNDGSHDRALVTLAQALLTRLLLQLEGTPS